MSNISSCKVCNNTLAKIAQPKSERGFRGHKDEQGRWWIGRVCPDCAPVFRKVRYRKMPEHYDEQSCNGCGKTYRPMRKNTTGTCSPKCGMRVKRKNSVKEMGKDKELLKIKLPDSQ